MMNNTNNITVQTRLKKDEMVLSLVADEQSCQETTQAENQLRTRLAKLSVNLKNYCNIDLRLLHIMDGESLQGLFMLNPECQIKILEETFLNRTRYRCSNFQIKSDCCSPQKVSKNSSLDKSDHSTLAQRLCLQDGTDILRLPNVLYKSHSTCSKEKVVNSDVKFSCILPLNGLKKDCSNSCFQNNTTVLDNFSSSKKEQSPVSKTSSTEFMSKNAVGRRPSVNSVSYKHHNDLDNDFEFTVEEEKIVSFVCSPSPPRKFKAQSDLETSNDLSNDSDQESDKHSEPSSSKGDSISETISNMSQRSKETNDMIKSRVQFHDWPKINNLLWHPPSQQKRLEFHSTSKAHVYSNSPSNNLTNPNLHQNIVGFHEPVTYNFSFNSQNRFKTSCAQETILFREASLRGCYNIESILKEVKPSLPNVQQEVIKVREGIFSAVRSQEKNENLISDSILSMMELVKTWIKLNSHFERDDFKDILEACGCDLSVIHDFLQWQCVSRMFIDKMIHVLRNISHRNTADLNSPVCDPSGDICASTPQPSSTRLNQGKDFSFDIKDNKNMFSSFKFDLAQTKHWKQRRFQADQLSQDATDTKHKRLLRSNLTVTNTFNGFQLPIGGSTDVGYGQGDSRLPCYNRDSNNSKLLGKYSCGTEDLGQFSNCSKIIKETSPLTGMLDKSSPLKPPLMNSIKEQWSIKGEINMYPPSLVNDTVSCPSTNVMNLPVNHRSAINVHSIPTVPPFCNNQPCFMSSNQCQPMNKPNPIHCIDTDLGENCIKSNYMKPGSYNPPQKPLTYQKVINNSLPIEDMPVVGIPFLYSNSQTPSLIVEVSKSFETSHSSPAPSHDVLTDSKSDDTWKAALTLAESFREHMIARKCNSNPNLKISDTVSLKSHFLLSDEFSQHSSNELKLDSEADDPNAFEKPTSTEIAIPVVEAQLKTSDWLMKSFDGALPAETVKENSTAETKYMRPECESTDMNKNGNSVYQQDQVKYKLSAPGESDKQSTGMVLNTGVQSPKTPVVNHLYQDSGSNFNTRKPRKQKKLRDDYTNVFDNKPTLLCRKPKSIFKRSMTKHMSCKLEEILNCIWNTELCDLVGLELKSEKDVARLDFKVKNPLYIQAMKCKLANHSYDNLEQALTDFQQYFLDIKGRNKGDKQCIEVVGAMEQLFLNLVEKQFGLLYQPAPQYFGPIGMAPNLKPRKPKKTSRRF